MKNKVDLIVWGNIVLLAGLSAILLAVSPFWGIVASVGSVWMTVISYRERQDQKKQREKMWEKALQKAAETTSGSTRQLLMELAVPCVIVDENGVVQWFNVTFGQMFPGHRLIGETVSRLFPQCTEWKDKETVACDVRLNEKIYLMMLQKLEGDQNVYGMTFLDVTRERELEDLYESCRIAAGTVAVDNYAEVMAGLSEEKQNQLTLTIETALYRWAAPLEGMFRRTDRDRFLLIVDQEHLNHLLEGKFQILNEVKQIKGYNEIPVTLSIGVGSHQKTLAEAVASSQTALELALGRGGDQAVVKQEEQFSFFGGNSRELEKRTRVKARVIAQALYRLIENAPDVIVMGHKNPDADCIGAALGISAIAKHLNTPARIVLGECNSSVKKLVGSLKKELPPIWIEPSHAKNFVHENTLLVVVDIHRPSLVECPELIDRSEHVVLIDHHRRSADFINRSVLMYQEPYASSASEMVSEILQYSGNGLKLCRAEAEALLCGIVLDTKNFTVKTNVRTFDAASYLRRQGADPVRVQNMFRTDLETYRKISEAVESAKIYQKKYAVTYCLPGKDDMQIMPMTADELLTIEGLQASFVLCPHEGHVHVSARSGGEINVQRIMEQLGGGGHQTAAGGVLEGLTLEQAKDLMIQTINEYENNEERLR